MQVLAKAIESALKARETYEKCRGWAGDVARLGTAGNHILSVQYTCLQLVKETTNQRPSCTLRAPSEFSEETRRLLLSDPTFIDQVLINLHVKVLEADKKVQIEADRVLKELQDAV